MTYSFKVEPTPQISWTRRLSHNLRRKSVLLVVGFILLIVRYLPDYVDLSHTPSDPSLNTRGHHTYKKEFPKNIWQARLGDAIDPARWANNTDTWKNNNPDWQYQLLTDETANTFVREHFAHRPAIINFWNKLGPIINRADFIRYLALLARGGVYGDIDTSNLVPMSEWIPEHLRTRTINAIIGIEYDDTTYALFVRPLCFSQWTIMAKPNHPLLETAVKRVMGNLEYLARLKQQELSNLTPNKQEVLQGTGPGMFSDAVLETLRDQTGRDLTWETFHDQKEPVIYGDVLVLPINGFGSGQKHSHSSKKEYGTAVIKHHFGKTWYTKQPAPAPAPAPAADAAKEKEKAAGEVKKP